MERLTGTTSRGIRTPIIRDGDNLCEIVVDSVIRASEAEKFDLHDRDVIAITESVVARAEGNYVSVDDIAYDIQRHFPDGEIGLVFPILSRNRFSLILKGVARGAKKITLLLSYPTDEVGNPLASLEQLDEVGINPLSDILTESRFRQLFGEFKHPYTGIDYLSFYREIIEAEKCKAEIILANDPRAILNYSRDILVCDIHSGERSRKVLEGCSDGLVYGLSDILAEPIEDSGYNEQYGLLGSNKASEETLKLFPRSGHRLVKDIAALFKERTGKNVEVMVYGDGAFKDPVGKIWELADPVVSPAYTEGLSGVPHEVKIKYLADHTFSKLSGQELEAQIRAAILAKEDDGDKSGMSSEGTTPRRIVDLLGSLADLTSGSGDKGTPVVLIQGYFDSLAV
ncbi:MAG TPA: coenzyme F420-0:L-glutamate ligase [Oscillospiraceae bacterium]|nr:coenzyme F420-0:L-glutamate ligase [Oscillospiraceae bacterium]